MLVCRLYFELLQRTGDRATDKYKYFVDAVVVVGEAHDVNERTVRGWTAEYQSHGYQFLEPLVGKHVR